VTHIPKTSAIREINKENKKQSIILDNDLDDEVIIYKDEAEVEVVPAGGQFVAHQIVGTAYEVKDMSGKPLMKTFVGDEH